MTLTNQMATALNIKAVKFMADKVLRPTPTVSNVIQKALDNLFFVCRDAVYGYSGVVKDPEKWNRLKKKLPK